MPSEKTTNHTHGRLLAKLVRQLLAEQSFESLADLTDALKFKCARLRLSCQPAEVAEAYRFIESNRPLVVSPLTIHARPRERVESGYVTRDQAADLVRHLRHLLEARDAMG
jgi:hypothetical protein